MGCGTFWCGWALAAQGQTEASLAEMHQGLAAVFATRHMVTQWAFLVILAEVAEHAGLVEEGLRRLAEARAAFKTSGLSPGSYGPP